MLRSRGCAGDAKRCCQLAVVGRFWPLAWPRLWRDASWHVSFALVRAEPQDAQLMHSGRPTNKASRLTWSCLTMEAVHCRHRSWFANGSKVEVEGEVPGARGSQENLIAGRGCRVCWASDMICEDHGAIKSRPRVPGRLGDCFEGRLSAPSCKFGRFLPRSPSSQASVQWPPKYSGHCDVMD